MEGLHNWFEMAWFSELPNTHPLPLMGNMGDQTVRDFLVLFSPGISPLLGILNDMGEWHV